MSPIYRYRPFGDRDLCDSFKAIAEKKLNEFKDRCALGGINQAKNIFTTEDGTVITLKTIRVGLADTDEIWIDTRKSKANIESKELIIFGYILRGLTSASDDPLFDQFFGFNVTCGNHEFVYNSGVSPDSPDFDNYPDKGAKYVSRGQDALDDVYFCRSYESYSTTAISGPSQIVSGPDLPDDPGLPALPSGYFYHVWKSCHMFVTHTITGQHWHVGIHDNLLVTNDGSIPPPPDFYDYYVNYPGVWPNNQNAFDADFFANRHHSVSDIIVPFINDIYAQMFADNSDSLGLVGTDKYVTVNNGYTIRKHKNDFGFWSNAGFYIDNDALVVSERFTTVNEKTVGQGFFVMFDKDFNLRIGQSIIDDNAFFATDDFGSIPSLNTLGGVFTQNEDGSGACIGTIPPNGQSLLEDAGGFTAYDQIQSPPALTYWLFEPAVYNTTFEEATIVLPTSFTITCNVIKGDHFIESVRRFESSTHKYAVEVTLFTSEGTFTRIVNINEFKGLNSKSKMKISVGILGTLETLFTA